MVRRIKRISIHTAAWGWSSAILDLAQPIMARLADTLQIALVERKVAVSAVRDDVVHYRGGNYPAHLCAVSAQRLGPELLESHTLPSGGVVYPAAGRH